MLLAAQFTGGACVSARSTESAQGVAQPRNATETSWKDTPALAEFGQFVA